LFRRGRERSLRPESPLIIGHSGGRETLAHFWVDDRHASAALIYNFKDLVRLTVGAITHFDFGATIRDVRYPLDESLERRVAAERMGHGLRRELNSICREPIGTFRRLIASEPLSHKAWK
jgi:hypothetical protein